MGTGRKSKSVKSDRLTKTDPREIAEGIRAINRENPHLVAWPFSCAGYSLAEEYCSPEEYLSRFHAADEYRSQIIRTSVSRARQTQQALQYAMLFGVVNYDSSISLDKGDFMEKKKS